MNLKNNTTRIGGLLLEALMIVFVVLNSWFPVTTTHSNPQGGSSLSVNPVEQLVFSDSHSSSESLLQIISKIQVLESEISLVAIDVPGLELSASEALFVASALYNTFYTNTTINAP